jgi:hypothetical protein
VAAGDIAEVAPGGDRLCKSINLTLSAQQPDGPEIRGELKNRCDEAEPQRGLTAC